MAEIFIFAEKLLPGPPRQIWARQGNFFDRLFLIRVYWNPTQEDQTLPAFPAVGI